MQEKDMIVDLVQESREHLQEIEPILLELERKQNDTPPEMINQLFRAIHSIKGGFSFFGYKQITSLSHSMENILSRIRDKNLSVTIECVDALLKGIDKLRVILDDYENSDSISIDAELEALTPFREANVEIITAKKSTTVNLKDELSKFHPLLKLEHFNDAINSGKFIYQIFLNSNKDFEPDQMTIASLAEKWGKLGKLIDCTVDHESIKGLQGSSESNLLYSIIFASVLEPDLIIMGLKVPLEQLRIIEADQLKSFFENKNTTTEPAKTVAAPSTAPQTESKSAEDSLRVKVKVLNNLMNLAGELVLSRNQLIQLFNKQLINALEEDKINGELSRSINSSSQNIKECCKKNPDLLDHVLTTEYNKLKESFSKILSVHLKELNGASGTLQAIDAVTSQLQENIMQTRLQPVSIVFSKFPRVIRDLSRKLNKQIELHIIGQDVELDKSIVELLSDPLTHLIRNCADHGIELPEDRVKSGKDQTGTIYLSAFQEGGKVIVEIEDDGRGLDLELIKKTAISKKLITEATATTMTQKELQMLIMLPGFSTAKEITDISGRGVGMDVVKSNIERLGGTIDIESEFGRGMTITLTLPLTLAIIPSLIISTEGRSFAIPQVAVEELVRIRSFEVTKKIERVQGSEVTRLRGKLLPLVRLSDVLKLDSTFMHPSLKERKSEQRTRWSDRRGIPDSNDDTTTETDASDDRRSGNKDRRTSTTNAVKIVVLKSNQNRYGLIVDSVYDSEEIVVKPLPEYFKSTQCYAGATILGDGKVVMILDPGGIALKASLRFTDLEQEQLKEQEKYVQKKSQKTQEVLLFDNGSNERFGLNLQAVARIEKADSEEIEIVGQNEFIKREGNSFPLVRIHDFLPVTSPAQTPKQFYIIFPKNSERRIGIIAETVYDVLETTVTLDTKNIKGTGIMGSTIINNRLTIILDMPKLLSEVELRLGN